MYLEFNALLTPAYTSTYNVPCEFLRGFGNENATCSLTEAAGATKITITIPSLSVGQKELNIYYLKLPAAATITTQFKIKITGRGDEVIQTKTFAGIVVVSSHTYTLSAPDNFPANEPKWERKHADLDDSNTTNDNAVKLAGLTDREVNVTFNTTIGSNNQQTFIPSSLEVIIILPITYT